MSSQFIETVKRRSKEAALRTVAVKARTEVLRFYFLPEWKPDFVRTKATILQRKKRSGGRERRNFVPVILRNTDLIPRTFDIL